MNERFALLRRKLSLTQSEMGDRLGLAHSGISNIENGNRNLSDRNIKLLCHEFGVNEIWLRTGVGEMFAVTDVDDKFSWLVGKTLAENDVFTKRLLIYIMELDEAQKESLKGLAKVLLDEE